MCAVVLAGCGSTLPPMLTHPRTITTDGPYMHRASRLTFPQTVQSFSRTQILEYDSVGETLSVEYAHAESACPITARLLVYVAPSDLPVDSPSNAVIDRAKTLLVDEHFRTLKRGLLKSHTRATLLTEETVILFKAGGAQHGRRGLFEYEDVLSSDKQLVRSDLYLFLFGKWALNYRMTYPARLESCGQAAVQEFLLSYAWPSPA